MTRIALTTVGLLLLALSGCHDDERAQVNRSQAQVAEASRQLVEADAKARTETIALQRELRQGQDQLEHDRRQYADQRNRDPIIANTILEVGMIIACLLPLALCIFLALGLRDASPADSDLANILVEEIVADEPVLLPSPGRPEALERESTQLQHDAMAVPPIAEA